MRNLMIRPAADVDFRALDARIGGTVTLYGAEGWDEARRAWNLAVDQHPAAVVHAASARDIAAVVDFAGAHGYQVAPQGTGHAAAPLGPLDDTILLKTSRMRGVTVDPLARVARAEAGALWEDVTHAAAVHRLAALAGSSPDVGVVGYTLGGGIGWLARKLGLAANSVTAVELVTADGRLVRADHETEPDLFWAVRGGGGNFGVVTALEFRLYPVETVYAGALFFPVARASEVLQAWRDWIDIVPEELTSVGRIMQFPPIPHVPEQLRGKAFAIVEAAFVGDPTVGAEVMRPLRALGGAIDTLGRIPAAELHALHMDPPGPVPGAGDGGLLTDVTAETIDTLAASVPGSPLVSVELRHLGGALGRPAPGHGALASVDGAFAWYAVGAAVDPEMKAAVEASVSDVTSALAPYDAGRRYLNFAERAADARRLFPEHVYHRLRRIRAQVDPAGVIRANHPIPAAV